MEPSSRRLALARIAIYRSRQEGEQQTLSLRDRFAWMIASFLIALGVRIAPMGLIGSRSRVGRIGYFDASEWSLPTCFPANDQDEVGKPVTS